MKSDIVQAVKRAGGISPCLSDPQADWTELGREFRRAGYQGVIFSNGRGRAADELLADLDPEVQARIMAGAESNHALLDALARELSRLPDRYTGELTRYDLQAENEALRAENRALESRLALLDPDPDESPRMDGITPESIRGARAALNLTQAEAAKRLGTSWLSISRWENARTRPKSPAHVRGLTAMLNEAKQAGMVVAEPAPF